MGLFDIFKNIIGDSQLQDRVKKAVSDAVAPKSNVPVAKKESTGNPLADKYLNQVRTKARVRGTAEDIEVRGAILQDMSSDGIQKKLNGIGNDYHIRIGNVPIDESVEQQHFLLAGAPGTGKSVTIAGMLKTIRLRNQKAIVFDPAGEFTSAFYREGKDAILNPLDARDAGWSPWSDLDRHEYASFSEIVIPPATGSQDPFFNQSAQTVLKCLMNKFDNIDDVLNAAISMKDNALRKIVEDQGMGGLMGPEKTFQSTRSTLANGIEKITPLYSIKSGEGFSFKKWIEDSKEDSWVFMPIRKDQQRQMKAIVAMYFQTLVMKGLSTEPDPKRRIWCIIDEFPSLGKISVLQEGIAEGRKYGLTFVLGLQSVSQVRDTYGKDGAQALYAMPKTRLILRVSDAETAEEMSKELGDAQVSRTTHSYSRSGGGPQKTSSYSESSSLVTERIVLPSEITGLPDLRGYLRTGSAFVKKIKISTEGLAPRDGVGSVPKPLRMMPWEKAALEKQQEEESENGNVLVKRRGDRIKKNVDEPLDPDKLKISKDEVIAGWSSDLITTMTDDDIERLSKAASTLYMQSEEN